MIRPADKSGMICIMDAEKYVKVIMKYLNATYLGDNGKALPYYNRVGAEILISVLENAKNLIMEGLEKGYIHPSEADQMMMG